MNRNLLKYFLLFSLFIFVISCGGKKRNPLKDLRPAEGGINYGGVLQTNENEMFRSLFPLAVSDIQGANVCNQVYEGLVKLSQKDLTIIPSLAEKWEIDSTNTIYTFYLRKGVLFHDDACFEGGKGRELKAKDVEYCFTKICSPSATNFAYPFFENRILGSNEYYESLSKGNSPLKSVSGINVIDEYTVQIKLTQPFSIFLYLLATQYCYIFPEEAVKKYGDDMRIKMVGTGPFRMKEMKEDEAVILSKNENYWKKDSHGNKLPYLDAVKVQFIKEKKSELLEFKKKNLDAVYRLPLEMMDEIVGKNNELVGDYKNYLLQSVPALFLQFYGFLTTDPVFKNTKVRQAFNYAIDRKKLVDYTLKGTGIAAMYGTVPPALVGYDSKAIKGYEFDPNKAKQLLSEAGFPNGTGFPEVSLQLNTGGGVNLQVAEAIQKMLKENLNIEVKFSILPSPQHYENLEMGKAPFFRFGWFADYPDAETFLNLFAGKHVPDNPAERAYLNSVRYNNPKFDSLLALSLKTLDEDERNLLYLQADQTIIDDAPIIPIYYEKYFRLIQPYVKNFDQNPMEYRDFSEVYFAENQKN